MRYRTEDGIELEIGRLDRRVIDEFVATNQPPEPPTETVVVWGEVEEEVPIRDDPGYRSLLVDYYAHVGQAQAELVAPVVTLPPGVDLGELGELREIGLDLPACLGADLPMVGRQTQAGVPAGTVGFLLYVLSPPDLGAITELVFYHSTVTERGIAEAEWAFNVTWHDRPLSAWHVPGTPGRYSAEFEARKAAKFCYRSWPEFCELGGPEQSRVVAFYRLSQKLEWLMYEEGKRK